MELVLLSLGGAVAVLFLQLSEFVRHRRTSRQIGSLQSR